MLKLLRSALLLPAVLVPFLVSSDKPVLSQERQGCFMVNGTGSLIDLSELCPSATTVSASEPQLGTGDIQATLRWSTSDDLDLAVTDPSGNTVTFFNPTVSSGGQLDVDANAGCGSPSQTPIENIFWPTGQAPQGSYSVSVNLFARCQGTGPISFNLTLLVQGSTQTLTGTVNDQNPVANFPFSLPQQNASPQASPQPSPSASPQPSPAPQVVPPASSQVVPPASSQVVPR